MSVPWEKVLTNPLGLAGYALCLVFGVVTLIAKKREQKPRWVIPAGFALAAICVLGGLALAYHRETQETPAKPQVAGPAGQMKIDKIEQKVTNGAAIAGVQGDVTVSPPPPQKDAQSKH